MLRVTPLARIVDADRDAVVEEGERLTFLGDGAGGRVAVEAAG